MKKYLNIMLDIAFRKESVYLEGISGVLLLILAFQSKAYFMHEAASSTLLTAIGIFQLAALTAWRCRKCFATRIFTSSAGAFVWLVVASHQFARTTVFDGAAAAALAGSLILSATMMLAVINNIQVRQRETEKG